MNTLILYKSKYGSTKQYAEWLHQEIPHSSLYPIEAFNEDFTSFQKVIIASCTYMGDIKARKYLVENWEKMKNKKVFLLAVGMVFNADAIKSFEMIPENIRKNIEYLKVPGRINVEKLKLPDKFIAKIMGDIKSEDRVEKKNIIPVVEYAITPHNVAKM